MATRVLVRSVRAERVVIRGTLARERILDNFMIREKEAG